MVEIEKREVDEFNKRYEKYFEVERKRLGISKARQKIVEYEYGDDEDKCYYDGDMDFITSTYKAKNKLMYEDEVSAYSSYESYSDELKKKYNVDEAEFFEFMCNQKNISQIYAHGDNGETLWNEYVKVYGMIQRGL